MNTATQPGAGEPRVQGLEPRICYVTQRDQYGAIVMKPDDAMTKEFAQVMGKKNVTYQMVKLLQVAGWEVRIRGNGECAIPPIVNF